MTALAERPPVRPRTWLVGAAAMFCCAWSGNQFTPLLAMYRIDDGFSTVTVDGLLAAYILGVVPALLVGGRQSDLHGRKRAMGAALSLAIAGSACLAVGSLPALAAGRLLTGVAVGLTMAVGSTWVVELSSRDGDAPATGARRAALWVTAGLCGGAAISGTLAQWGPLPKQLPYIVQASCSLVLLLVLLGRGIETVSSSPDISRRGELLPTVIRRPRFRRLVLPVAPWIFGTSGIAYATIPEILDAHVGNWKLLYATIMVVITLGVGFLVQPIAHRLDHHVKPRALTWAAASATVGLTFAIAAVAMGRPWFGFVSAAALGCGYGLAVVAGLLEMQRLAEPRELARAVGVLYTLAYTGFLFPVIIAIASHWMSATAAVSGFAGISMICTIIVASTRFSTSRLGAEIG